VSHFVTVFFVLPGGGCGCESTTETVRGVVALDGRAPRGSAAADDRGERAVVDDDLGDTDADTDGLLVTAAAGELGTSAFVDDTVLSDSEDDCDLREPAVESDLSDWLDAVRAKDGAGEGGRPGAAAGAAVAPPPPLELSTGGCHNPAATSSLRAWRSARASSNVLLSVSIAPYAVPGVLFRTFGPRFSILAYAFCSRSLALGSGLAEGSGASLACFVVTFAPPSRSKGRSWSRTLVPHSSTVSFMRTLFFFGLVAGGGGGDCVSGLAAGGCCC
jgi:hypothetical protein